MNKQCFLKEKYKNLGLKLTPQRIAIFEFLEGNTSHPSAEEIFQHVSEKYPTMSFSTVYNTLEALRKNNQVMELTIDQSRKRYDPNTEHHHHLICTKCKKIRDIHKVFPLNLSAEERGDFIVTGNHVEFYGLCGECKEEAFINTRG